MAYANTSALTVDLNPLSNFNKKYILRISIISALGGMLFGFDTAVISGTIPFIQKYFRLDEVTLGWAVSSILLGCGLGAMLAGKIADALGRKLALFICAFLFAATGIGVALAESLFIFTVFRIAGGISVGAVAMVVPMYIAETSPAPFRGRMVALYQLAIVLGILLAYVANYTLSDLGENSWRWMFAAQAIPAVIFFFALFLVPETPRWLIQKSQKEKAYNVLSKTGGQAYAEAALRSISNSFASQSAGNLKDLFLPQYSKVLFMGILIASFQQITGINAVLYYAPEIFKSTGVSAAVAAIQTIAIGVTMLVFTLVAIWLVDKVGRKKLLLAGCLVMVISLLAVATCFYLDFYQYYLVLIFLLIYIAGFSASLGAVTWVILSEIFPNRIRGLALSLVTLILWLADFLASISFPVLNKYLGTSATLALFAAFCLVYFVYLKFRVPETKGKTLEELEAQLINQ
ncbi:sugar porter family MFS transporter [Dyadobacter diqingensis]|uniref:sugar porter family MFS transporter n=1 Tax=Dyadobacter diqingensis TaxID=2938121 RepID=UPI0020C24070|nr:sugar porter family MFS transporter [Dyadobacter diqingensis]